MLLVGNNFSIHTSTFIAKFEKVMFFYKLNINQNRTFQKVLSKRSSMKSLGVIRCDPPRNKIKYIMKHLLTKSLRDVATFRTKTASNAGNR